MDAYNTLRQSIPFNHTKLVESDIEEYLDAKYNPLFENAHKDYKLGALARRMDNLNQKRRDEMIYYNRVIYNFVTQFLENEIHGDDEIVVSLGRVLGDCDEKDELLIDLAFRGFTKMLREKNYQSDLKLLS